MITREDILSYALALPPEDRELVVVALQDSLQTAYNSGESLVGNEFHRELERRSDAYRAGESHCRPATEVMNELFQRQANESSS